MAPPAGDDGPDRAQDSPDWLSLHDGRIAHRFACRAGYGWCGLLPRSEDSAGLCYVAGLCGDDLHPPPLRSAWTSRSVSFELRLSFYPHSLGCEPVQRRTQVYNAMSQANSTRLVLLAA